MRSSAWFHPLGCPCVSAGNDAGPDVTGALRYGDRGGACAPPVTVLPPRQAMRASPRRDVARRALTRRAGGPCGGLGREQLGRPADVRARRSSAVRLRRRRISRRRSPRSARAQRQLARPSGRVARRYRVDSRARWSGRRLSVAADRRTPMGPRERGERREPAPAPRCRRTGRRARRAATVPERSALERAVARKLCGACDRRVSSRPAPSKARRTRGAWLDPPTRGPMTARARCARVRWSACAPGSGRSSRAGRRRDRGGRRACGTPRPATRRR